MCAQARLTARRNLHARALILSRHCGFVAPGTLIAPYEQPHPRSAALTPHTVAKQLADNVVGHSHVTIHAYTTRANVALLRAAAATLAAHTAVELDDAFATAHGIGYQKQVISHLRREQEQRMAEYGWHL
ncbi:hypothetical protein KUTG_10001 [Kutzneria sp. 744]|nr:hypothetical protein KUTG_10001 [Kutzneria sp. 744]